VESNDPPKLESLNPTQIEKIMIQELLEKPKRQNKSEKVKKFDFVKTVKPTMESFKKQLLDDKNKMQKQLDDNIKTMKACVLKMKKKLKSGLLEVEKKKKKKKSQEVSVTKRHHEVREKSQKLEA